jgi:hypothetical protein
MKVPLISLSARLEQIAMSSHFYAKQHCNNNRQEAA